MRLLRHSIFAAAFLAVTHPIAAQKTGTVELGVLAHYTLVNNDDSLGSHSAGFGGRGGIFLLRWLEAEIEYSRGSVKNGGERYTDNAWYPMRILGVANIPLRPRAKLLLGAGTVDTYKGDITHSEFEEGISLLAGLRVCVGDAWSVRPEIIWDRTPDPATWMQRDFLADAHGATSTRLGLRIGVSRFFGRGAKTCAEGAPAAPLPPAARPAPAPVPPPAAAPPPPPAPTASVSASPAQIVAGQSSTLAWSSTNATRCAAPWMSGNAASGSQSVSPTSNTTYSVTCTGAGGSGNASTTVSVTQPAPPPITPPPAAAPPPRAAPREMFRLPGVFFDFDKATLKPAGEKELDSAVTVLKQYPDMRVEIQGHTDSLGADAYNMSLSERRAKAVKEYLTSKGISASRMTAKGYGETQPAADNGTKAGRAENRRVVIVEIRS